MLRLRMMSIPAALLLTASAAGAQRWGGTSGTSGGPAGHGSPPVTRPTGTAPHSAAASSNGTISKWGGSPPERPHNRERGWTGFYGQPNAYIPVVVAAPAPVPAYADPSSPPAPDASVDMPVITTRHEERQLTTIEVYRLQPRFQKP